MEQLASLLPIILIIGVFWLLIMRPARNRQREVMAVQRSLEPGVEVITTAGIYATVHSIEGDQVVLEVAPGVFSRFTRQAVVRVVPPEAADLPSEEETREQQGQTSRDVPPQSTGGSDGPA